MSKQRTNSTLGEEAPKRRQPSADEVFVDAARHGDTAAVRAGLEKRSPDADSKTVFSDAVHEACRGNHDECLALLLPYVETTQMSFGILLSECVHAYHVACREVLLQHWKSVCSNVAFVPYEPKNSGDQTPPSCPAMWADPAVCRAFIDAGADIETQDEKGCAPLLAASRAGALTTVKMLVEAGARVRVTDENGDTCLISAAYFGHTETVRYLVGLPEMDVGCATEGRTALSWAALKERADVVQVLIDAGADIETKDSDGRSPLHVVSCSGALAIAKMLVEAGADVRGTENEGCTCLLLASYFCQTETVRYLVSLPQVEVDHQDSWGRTALCFAAQGNHPDAVEVLIDAGADVDAQNSDGLSPLHLCSVSGALTIVKMLIRAGAGVCVTDNEGDTCLIRAATFGQTETVRYLVGLPQVEVDHTTNEGATALYCAVQEEHPDVVQVLIDAGANIEAKDQKGRSAVLVASCAGTLALVKMLVKAGADVSVTDDEGGTCLSLASYFGHTETVRYLVGLTQMEVDRATEGKTALYCAVQEEHADVVQVLIDAGADIEAKDQKGRSAVLVASCAGTLALVKMLVKAGADLRVTDNEGGTCLTLASSFGHNETVRYLVGLPQVEVDHQDSSNRTALQIASQKHHSGVIIMLIDAVARRKQSTHKWSGEW